MIQQVDSTLIPDSTPATASSLNPIEFPTDNNTTQSQSSGTNSNKNENNENNNTLTVETNIHQHYGDEEDPFREAPVSSTRSRSTALYSALSRVSLTDSDNAILSGKYYDPDYELYFNAAFPLISCGVMTEDEALRTSEHEQWRFPRTLRARMEPGLMR